MKRDELKAQLEAQKVKDRQDFAKYLAEGKKKFGCDLLPVTFFKVEDKDFVTPVQNVLNMKIDIQVVNV